MERRDFLKAGISAAVAVSIPGITLSIPKRAEAAVLTYSVIAQRQDKPIDLGLTIPVWQYIDAATGMPLQLTVVAGDSVTLTLQNLLTVPVNFEIPGILANAPVCLPGQTQVYTFIAPASPGTYAFYDISNGLTGRAMGLGGALVILPADGIARLYDGGPTYNRDHLLIMQEFDTRLNDAVSGGGTYDITSYEPNYFFVNGTIYTGTQKVELMLGLNENVAIRFVNIGLIYYPMHFHGYHVNVATRNRLPEQSVVDKDTVLVKTGECVETILAVGQQAGLYPLHTHYLPGVTNNGTYAGGGLIMMNAA